MVAQCVSGDWFFERRAPPHPITVYRGTRPEGRQGLSWTLREYQAKKFADYWWDHGYRHPPGHVYKVRVAPRNILAIISGHNKTFTPKPPDAQKGIFDDQVSAECGPIRFGGEDEVIVDARRL